MSQENVEIVRALVERWNAADRVLEVLPDYFAVEIELESPFSSVVGEPYRGYAGVERWMRDLDEQFAEWSISLEDARSVDNQVLTVATIRTRGRVSEIALEFPSGAVFHFGHDHRVTRIRIYADVDEALNAVGLER